MDKNKIITIGSMVGAISILGYKVYETIKQIKKEKEIIDITPQAENDEHETSIQ